MRILVVRASIRYSGRIDAEVGLGDRVILIKGDPACIDGCVIHGLKGVNPKNWMPAGSVVREQPGLIEIRHAQRGELLEIFVERILSDQTVPLELDGPLVKLGSERELSDRLVERLELIQPGLELVAREYRTPAGPIDLLCRLPDAGGDPPAPVAVEVKRNRVTNLEVLYQLKRYLDALAQMEQWAEGPPARGVIVAAGFGRELEAAARAEGVQIVRVRYGDLA